MKKRYIIVTWPDSQELMELEGFRDNSYLINDDKGLDDFGSSEGKNGDLSSEFNLFVGQNISILKNLFSYRLGYTIPAWSLAALLDVLPKIINNETLFIETSAALWHIGYRNIYIARADNPIDACVETIIKLHERGLL